MTENGNEIIDSTIDTEITDNQEEIEIDLTDEAQDSEGEETITIPKKKWTEALAQKDHWKNKAEKKRFEQAGEKKQETATIQPTLSLKDQMALLKADVNEDDLDEVIDFAQYKKISIADAVKHPVVRATLKEKEEFRLSQKASAGTDTKRATQKSTPEATLAKAREGKLPEDLNEAEKLFNARYGLTG